MATTNPRRARPDRQHPSATRADKAQHRRRRGGAGMNAPAAMDADCVAASPPLLAEPTAIGLQCLVPGVVPITPRDRLVLRAAAPLSPRRPQRACDHGLFDTAARDQLDLFQPAPPAPREGS